MDRLRLINIMLLLAVISALVLDQNVLADPSGATIVSNVTETVPVAPAGSLTTAGGTFTTLVLNVSSQTPRWKAYVGNITGEVTLSDASSQTIYDWTLSVITGEVFASRNDSINWDNIQCANRSTILTEDTFLNMTSSKEDSINRTFNQSIHAQFFVGGTVIANSSCPAIATYVNDAKQAPSENADFQEILLQDGTKIVYTTLLEDDAQGYHENKTFDFQMILAENELNPTPTTYYFYAELG